MIGGQTVTGRENIRQTLSSVVAGRAQMTLDTRAMVESPQGVAVLHGGWTMEAPAGAAAGTRGLSTEVVRRQPDGTWLFVIDSPHTPV